MAIKWIKNFFLKCLNCIVLNLYYIKGNIEERILQIFIKNWIRREQYSALLLQLSIPPPENNYRQYMFVLHDYFNIPFNWTINDSVWAFIKPTMVQIKHNCTNLTRDVEKKVSDLYLLYILQDLLVQKTVFIPFTVNVAQCFL